MDRINEWMRWCNVTVCHCRQCHKCQLKCPILLVLDFNFIIFVFNSVLVTNICNCNEMYQQRQQQQQQRWTKYKCICTNTTL